MCNVSLLFSALYAKQSVLDVCGGACMPTQALDGGWTPSASKTVLQMDTVTTDHFASLKRLAKTTTSGVILQVRTKGHPRPAPGHR